MRTKLSHLAVAGVIGLAGATGAVVVGPSVAAAATGSDSAVTSRLTALKDALKGLVGDGTLTQAQADKVAATLQEELPRRGLGGHGGRGGIGAGGLDAAAEAIGVTKQELRSALRDGKSLARVAADEGVSKDALVTALVKAAQARLDEAVAEGRLTRARADERKADLEERITEAVDRVGFGRGPGGHRHGDGRGAAGDRDGRGAAGDRDGRGAPGPGSDSGTPSRSPGATSGSTAPA